MGGPRIPPLADEEMDDETRTLLATMTGPAAGGAANIFTTLVRHKGLFRRWAPFGGKLLAGRLSPRDRELLILRTAWRCQSVYEWGQHARIGRAAGLTDADLERIVAGPDAAGWEPFEARLLRVADELHDSARISDESWAALADRFDQRQLIEVPMLVGHYHLVAFALNSLDVEREEGVEGFPG